MNFFAKMTVTNIENDFVDVQQYDLEEIKKHIQLGDKWIIINELVYDVSKWQFKHPGGARLLGHFIGQDATVRYIFIKYCFFMVKYIFAITITTFMLLFRYVRTLGKQCISTRIK